MLHYLFGSLCVLCRQRVTGALRRLQLCANCLADLPWRDTPEVPTDSVPMPLARQVAPLGYAGAPQRWVLAAKRDTGLVAARVLGSLLAETLLDVYPFAASRPDVIVPVPLSRRRLIGRGHNQAVLIAEPVSRALKIPLDRFSVRRSRHTPIQPGQDPSARAANVRGAFGSRRNFKGRRIAIVDDVVTTGATATTLARTLLDAGASEVHLWCPTSAAKLVPSQN